MERFVYTSSLYTLAAGTPEQLADESSAWNLHRMDSSYTRTKREAERMVLEANGGEFTTDRTLSGDGAGTAGPEADIDADREELFADDDRRRTWGGIPIVDSRLLAIAHRRALVAGGSGQRYAVVGPYMSYGSWRDMVASITGRPRWIVPLPDLVEPLVVTAAVWFGPLCGGRGRTCRGNWWAGDFCGCISAANGQCCRARASLRAPDDCFLLHVMNRSGSGPRITDCLRPRVVGDIHRLG